MALVTAGAMSFAGPLVAQPPVDEKAPFKATMDTFQIPSHGSLLNALVYMAAGEGPHPVVVLLHGFPGNEKNLDVAQAIRRAGWDVLYFNYRGSWGTPGDFSFEHGIEDVAAAVKYLREPENAKRLRVDSKKIVVIGHSMGGFMAVQATAADPGIMAFGLISAADMRGAIPLPVPDDPRVLQGLAASYAEEGLAPLAGCTPEGLAKELLTHAQEWDFLARAAALKSRPALVVTIDDGLAPSDNALAAALHKDGDARVTVVHFATDHAYSDKRLELTDVVVKWLQGLETNRR
jgi:pimeloyl-ACP methyl ester carboxylesterase